MPPYGNHGGIIRKSVLSAVIVQMYLIIIKGVSISISSEATYIYVKTIQLLQIETALCKLLIRILVKIFT